MNRLNLMGREWLLKRLGEVSPKEPVPDRCVFCSTEIKSEDFYWLGYDRFNIFASTCDDFHCRKWLDQKVMRRKE